MCIEQTSDGMAEMGAALCAVQRRERAMAKLRSAAICKGEAPICSRTDALSSGTDLLSSATAKLCTATEKNGIDWRWRSEERRWHGWGCPALRGISGQRTCEGAEKRGAKKQVHREARAWRRRDRTGDGAALLRLALALKGDAPRRHRGAVTRRAREMGSMDKSGISLAEKRCGMAPTSRATATRITEEQQRHCVAPKWRSIAGTSAEKHRSSTAQTR